MSRGSRLFSVTIHRRAGDVAIANEESISVSKEVDQWVAEQFKQTQPSPTYLVALAVGPFDILEQDPIPPSEWRKEPIRLRGIAAKGKAGALQYALDAHREVLLYQEAHLKTPYVFGKMDFIAVPDFKRVRWRTPGQLPTGTFSFLSTRRLRQLTNVVPPSRSSPMKLPTNGSATW